MIENSILRYFEGKCGGMFPHLATITSLCIQGGVKKEWGIEETYPRASPLTLTGITKGLKNRGKGREKETLARKRNERSTEIEQWESQALMQPEVQRNQYPISNKLPDQRQNHNEQAECSRKDCNNGELMGMLMSTRQEMKARDDQLRTQLQLREEYFDADLKRRDQNLEDALRKRDEEWRLEIEKNDQEWRAIFRDKDNALKASMDSKDNKCKNILEHYK